MAAFIAASLAILAEPGVQQALWLSAQVALMTMALHAVAGVLLACALSRKGWPGRALVDLLITLPLVFPPMALGFVLLLLLGRNGLIGRPLAGCCGVEIIFTPAAVVLSSFVAGLPLVVKPVQAALESLAGRLGEVARTLGRREWEILLFVLLPNVKRALLTGLMLALARSLGEVGITLMLGGNIAGRTNTVSLEIFNAVTGGELERALVLTLLLGAVSALVFLGLRRLGEP